MIDIVTVYHNEKNKAQAGDLLKSLQTYESGNCIFIAHSNIEDNKGFSKACNIGASQGHSPIIGFLNPDVILKGPFSSEVESILSDEDVMVTGCRFDKPQFELKIWGIKDWVCGATFFVKRHWFEQLNGFDERYEWSHEETDFILKTERMGKIVQSTKLPIFHDSPTDDTEKDRIYKARKFEEARVQYRKKWGLKV